MHQKMELCVQSELAEYMVELERQKTQALQQAMVAKHEESDNEEPFARRQGFWQTFHRGTRKGDWRPVTPAKTELYLPTIDGAAWVAPSHHSQDVKPIQRSALSNVKSAPELKKRVPFLTQAQEVAAADRDQARFTPPDAMRGGHRKTWWFQTGFQEHRLSIEHREEVVASKRPKNSLPSLVKHRCPMSHFGAWQMDEDEGKGRIRSKKSTSKGHSAGHGRHLPPIEDAVVPVHGDSEDLDASVSPTKQYIHACQRNQVVPVPSSFVTGHSKKVDAGGKALVDSDSWSCLKLFFFSYFWIFVPTDGFFLGMILANPRTCWPFVQWVAPLV